MTKQSASEFIVAYWLTLLIAVLCCVPFGLLQWRGLVAIENWFMPVLFADLWRSAQFTGLWSPTFVHYTWLHLLTNLYLWWLYASQLENENRRSLLTLFLFAAAVTNFLQWSYSGPKFGGLSGVIYFLLALMWVVNRLGVRHYKLDPIISIGLLVLIPLAATGLFGKFANVAHISGLILGGLAGLALWHFESGSPTKSD